MHGDHDGDGGERLAEAPVIIAGTHEQKAKYLGRMTEEPLQAAYGVTEPGAGSDVAGLATTAVKKGDEWVLNGQKMWITNGGVANWYFVLAKTDATAKTGRRSPASSSTATRRGSPSAARRSTWGSAARTRAASRSRTSSSPTPTASAPRARASASRWAPSTTRGRPSRRAPSAWRGARCRRRWSATTRKTMGTMIAGHQAVSFMLADMAMGIEASRMLVYKSAYEIDNGRKNTLFASMAKAFAGDHANKVAADAVQIFGGNGFNTEYPVEKLMRDAKIYQIYEGTSQIQRMIIARELIARGDLHREVSERAECGRAVVGSVRKFHHARDPRSKSAGFQPAQRAEAADAALDAATARMPWRPGERAHAGRSSAGGRTSSSSGWKASTASASADAPAGTACVNSSSQRSSIACTPAEMSASVSCQSRRGPAAASFAQPHRVQPPLADAAARPAARNLLADAVAEEVSRLQRARRLGRAIDVDGLQGTDVGSGTGGSKSLCASCWGPSRATQLCWT